jgi:hypothetical protein
MMDQPKAMSEPQDNRSAVLAVLRGAARRLLAVRAGEAAAVGAVAAGLAVTAAQAGLLAGRVHPVLGAAIALLPIVAAVAVLRWPALRRAARLDGRDARIVAATACGIAAIGALVVLAGRAVPQGRLLLPISLVPLGAAAAAAGVALRGITLGQAALYHDIRFGLAERLITAAELAEAPADGVQTQDHGSGGGTDPRIARWVFDQAVAVAGQADLARRGLWRRTRATAGALVLAAALCTVLALISPPGSARASADSFDDIRDRVRMLNPRGKRQLVEALQRLAERVERNPALHRRLLAAAAAAAKDQQLDSRLVELQDAVADADDAQAAAIARAILRAVGLPAGPDGGGDEPGGPNAAQLAGGGHTVSPAPAIDANTLDANQAEKPLPARTLVYNPAYAALADANPGAPGLAPQGATPATQFVHLDDAWSQARARAAEAMRANTIPPEYRDIVRRFFEIQ